MTTIAPDPATTAEPTAGDPDGNPSEAGAEGLCWVAVDRLVPHPENPRSDLGDLTELTRSVRAQGVLEPLVLLPSDKDGRHVIVAGHRRHRAAQKAGLGQVPAVVRGLTEGEVIEAMLSENCHRDALSVGDEVRAIERLMSLDDGLSPAKLCRRIGKSQAWVRSRMAVTVLPARWREALDAGQITLAAAEAAASAADLGPDHLDELCDRLTGTRVADPASLVNAYRKELRRKELYEKALNREREAGITVYTRYEDQPKGARRLDQLFRPDTAKAHVAEPCHAVLLRSNSWTDTPDRTELCTQPRRHSPKQVAAGKGSRLAADQQGSSTGSDPENSHAKRKGRLARLDRSAQTWAKGRGRVSQAQLTRLALRALVFTSGLEAVTYAATILGYPDPKNVEPSELLRAADTPTKLARVAGAVACGLAEARMYHWYGSEDGRDYLELLCGTGWEPDDWTAQKLAQHHPSHPPRQDQANSPDANAGQNGSGDEALAARRRSQQNLPDQGRDEPRDEARDELAARRRGREHPRDQADDVSDSGNEIEASSSDHDEPLCDDTEPDEEEPDRGTGTSNGPAACPIR